MRCHFRQKPYLRHPACWVLALMLSSPAAFAESGLFLVPWLGVEELYDDNIFFDAEDPVSDFYTRVSPQLDLGFESETLRWLMSYRNDAEWYNDLTELDSNSARSFAVGRIEYQPNRRWTLVGDANYTKTNSAEDITLTPGGGIPGLVGRNEAERLLFAGGANYLITPSVSGDLAVSWVQDTLIGSSLNETLSAATAFEQIMTPARSILYGYRYRNYKFETETDADTGFVLNETEDSNTAWVGLAQALSETSDLELQVGPRVSAGDLEPYVFVNWRRQYARGSVQIGALWDDSTLLGEVGILDSRSVQANWTHEFSSDLEVTGTAGYAYLTGTGFSTDIATFELSGVYQFNSAIFMTARYAFNTQKVDSLGDDTGRVNHGVMSIAITFTRPRRDTERSPS